MGVCYDSVLVCGWAEGMDDGGSGENWSRWGRGGGDKGNGLCGQRSGSLASKGVYCSTGWVLVDDTRCVKDEDRRCLKLSTSEPNLNPILLVLGISRNVPPARSANGYSNSSSESPCCRVVKEGSSPPLGTPRPRGSSNGTGSLGTQVLGSQR